jgi:gluconate kinase, SKI family
MEARIGHFMPPLLLDSQLNALEPLEADEWGIVVENTAAIQHVVDAILAWIGKNPA